MGNARFREALGRGGRASRRRRSVAGAARLDGVRMDAARLSSCVASAGDGRKLCCKVQGGCSATGEGGLVALSSRSAAVPAFAIAANSGGAVQ
jgi:hypothetical protein